MQQNPDAIRKAMALAATAQGQQLLNLLRRNDPVKLQQAMESAASGNTQQAKALLSNLLQDPEARRIIEQLGGSHGSVGR